MLFLIPPKVPIAPIACPVEGTKSFTQYSDLHVFAVCRTTGEEKTSPTCPANDSQALSEEVDCPQGQTYVFELTTSAGVTQEGCRTLSHHPLCNQNMQSIKGEAAVFGRISG
jgi:hypothetical protein